MEGCSSSQPSKNSKLILQEGKYVKLIGEIIERDFFPDIKELRDKVDTPSMVRDSSLPSSSQKDLKNASESEEDLVKNKTLDQFFMQCDCEDNFAFTESSKQGGKPFKEKHSSGVKRVGPSRLEDGLWKAESKPIHFYPPETNSNWKESSWKNQTIVHANTRLQGCPFNDELSKIRIQECAESFISSQEGKVGIDGEEFSAEDRLKSRRISSYFENSYPETQLMTWGDIEETPNRIRDLETPRIAPNQSFRMSEIPKKDVITHSLVDNFGKKKRKPTLVVERQKSQYSLTYRQSKYLETMSPSAQRLALSTTRKVDLWTPSRRTRNLFNEDMKNIEKK